MRNTRERGSILQLEGEVAIVTGAARGLGKAIALRLAENGADVVAADVCGPLPSSPYGLSTADQLEEVVSLIKKTGQQALGVRVDVGKSAQVKNMAQSTIDRFGKVDILVNNAGVITAGSVIDLKEEEWDLVFDVNTKGTFLCCKYVLPHMVERRKGKVINIGSAAAKNPKPAISHYSASKAAVVAFTMSLAKEMAEHGVQVNAVCPGSVRTDIWKGLTPYYSRFWRVTEEEVVRRFLNAVLLGEVRSEDIAEMVIFLSSPKADRITGQAINVCGGEDIHY